MKHALIRSSAVIALALAGPLHAVTSASAGVGARWSEIPHEPRAAGMGMAGLALERGASALGSNPAGLSLRGQELDASYLSWDEDIRLQRLAYGLSLGDLGTAGLRADLVDFGTVETFGLSNGQPTPGADLHPYAGALGLAYNAALRGGLSAGLELRGLYEDLGGDTASSGAVDLGLRWAPAAQPWALGFALRNAGAPLHGARLPLEAGLGAAWAWAPRQGAALRAAGDLLLKPESDESATLAAGLEYALDGLGAFRAGYRQGPDQSPSGPSAGFSVDLGFLSLDYAFSDWGGQGANQLGLRARWGGAATENAAAVPAASAVPAATPAPTPAAQALAQQVAATVDQLLQAVDSQDKAASQAIVQSMAQQAPELRDKLASAVKEEAVAPSVFQGEFKRAESYLRTMTRLRHEDPYAWMALGTVLWFQGRDAECLDAYQRSYLLDPSQSFLRARIVQLGGTVPAP